MVGSTLRHQLRDRSVFWVAIPLLFLAASIAFLAIALIASATATPLENVVPQLIAEEGPFHAGDRLSVTAIKCNHSGQPVDVTVTAVWEHVDSATLQTVPFVSGVVTRAPGCTTHQLNPQIPELSPGMWRLTGWDETADGQREPWYTENFDVIP